MDRPLEGTAARPVDAHLPRREPGPVIRSLTALILRASLALIFLSAGLTKLEAKRSGDYPQELIHSFNGTFLASDMPWALDAFAQALPYLEIGLGGMLALGLFTTFSATLSGVLLLHLLFGTLMQGDPTRYPAMFTYLLVNAAVLWLSQVRSNYLSLDGLIFGVFFGVPEGEETLREVVADAKAHAHLHR